MFLSCTLDNIEVSSANSLMPSGKSFMYMRNKRGPNTESQGTPESLLFQGEHWLEYNSLFPIVKIIFQQFE